MQHDAPTPMPSLAQFVGLASFMQGEGLSNNRSNVAFGNQLSNSLQEVAGGKGKRCRVFHGANATLLRFLLGRLLKERDKRSTSFDHIHRTLEGLATYGVQHQVHIMHHLLKRRRGIINHGFCAQGAHKIHVGRPSGADDLCALPPGELDRE